jgi:hypothetical protein
MNFLSRWIASLFGTDKSQDDLTGEAQVDAVAVNAQATRLLVKEVLANHRAERRWKLARRSLYALSIVVGIAISIRFSFPETFDLPGGGDKVAIISIKGNILSGAPASADQVVPAPRSGSTSRSTASSARPSCSTPARVTRCSSRAS